MAIVFSLLFYFYQLYSWHLEQQKVSQLFQQSFNASINQYEYLPALLAQDQSVKNALKYQQHDHLQLNQNLAFISSRSGASFAFVMNINGQVIASSNFNESNSFINKNYSFRPYFSKAVSQRKKQFYYAIGATTGTPGFFISEPIIDNSNTILGVVVVKLDLSDLENSWQESDQNIVLSDDNSVIILSSQNEWRYQTVGKLSKNTLNTIQNTRQFHNQPLNNILHDEFQLTNSLGHSLLFWQLNDGLYLINTFNVSESGWTLYSLKKHSELLQASGLFLLIFITGLTLIYLYLSERRSKLLSRLKAAQDIKEINASLEEKVHKRTQALQDAQDELVQQNKIAALGQMAATIVHELSQPLSAMNSSIAAIKLKADKNNWDGALKSVSRLSPLSKKMNDVVKLLKSFSYQDDSDIQQQELKPLIEKTLQLYSDCLKEKNVLLKPLKLASNIYVKVNPIKLDLVIVNIIQNAVDAMEKCAQPEISIVMKTEQQLAVIYIEDNGGGINSRIMGRLFNPYFTTKDIGKGLGLGLSICHEIIREYGGSIEVNNLEQGAQFIIKLPIYSSHT